MELVIFETILYIFVWHLVALDSLDDPIIHKKTMLSTSMSCGFFMIFPLLATFGGSEGSVPAEPAALGREFGGPSAVLRSSAGIGAFEHIKMQKQSVDK